MFVLEVGPGKGTYTLEIVGRVPNGKVVAIDIQESDRSTKSLLCFRRTVFSRYIDNWSINCSYLFLWVLDEDGINKA